MVIHYDQDGEVSYRVCGDSARLFIVDDRAPSDRVYEWLSRDSKSAVSEILGSEESWGSKLDGQHDQLSRRILHAAEGLSLVKANAPTPPKEQIDD